MTSRYEDLRRLEGLLRSVAEPGERLVPARAPADRLGRGEDALQVHRAVRRGLGRVGHDHLPEVRLGPQRAGGQPPHLEEVQEVAELVQGGQPFDRVGGQRDAVAPGDLQQRPGPHGALQVHVQLDLRMDHDAPSGPDYPPRGDTAVARPLPDRARPDGTGGTVRCVPAA